jgi:hypothetical protein
LTHICSRRHRNDQFTVKRRTIKKRQAIRLADEGRFAIGAIKLSQVAANALLDLRDARLDFVLGEILVTIIDRFELGSRQSPLSLPKIVPTDDRAE